jgi:glyceraldehyde 3-phosphate dehydrogenase
MQQQWRVENDVRRIHFAYVFGMWHYAGIPCGYLPLLSRIRNHFKGIFHFSVFSPKILFRIHTKMVKVAVNGFGRIGRLVFRFAWEDPTLEVVHVNDLCSCESAAYLLKYDSVHGTWDRDVKVLEGGDAFSVVEENGACTNVSFTREKDYTNIDFRSMGVEMVLECTGKFLTVKSLSPYFDLGIQRVVVSAPVKEEGALNVVLGCNHHLLTEDTKIVTNASCTTNCLAPIVKVIKENFGIKHGCITVRSLIQK